MRILFLASRMTYPPVGGNRLRWKHSMRAFESAVASASQRDRENRGKSSVAVIA